MINPENGEPAASQKEPPLFSRRDLAEPAFYTIGMGVLLYPINRNVPVAIWCAVTAVFFFICVGLVLSGNLYRRRKQRKDQQGRHHS